MMKKNAVISIIWNSLLKKDTVRLRTVSFFLAMHKLWKKHCSCEQFLQAFP